MNWDKKTKHVDKEMSYTANSMRLLRRDLRSIQDKLKNIMKENNGK
jgi:hypothetical protein